MQTLHVAFDDTDSRAGRCTTHLAFKVADQLKKAGEKLVDYPLLIRLNPNIPWKTRGNGAVCLRLQVQDVGRVVDHTFELIAYRKPENCGTPRVVDEQRVIKFSANTYPNTFNNYDANHGRVLIAPHGPDPVFFGVRGESQDIVRSALPALQPEEELDGWTIFRSNQGTNMHLQNEISVAKAKAYTAGHVKCRVKSRPYAMEGGHVIFTVEQKGAEMPAAVYEPTGLANVAALLEVGDIIEIGVGVRKGTTKHPKILNVEYLVVFELAPAFVVLNPVCKMCGKRMKSEGKNKGYQCDRCKHKDAKAKKILVPQERGIKTGLYIPTPKAHRHLTKPLQRYGIEKSDFQLV